VVVRYETSGSNLDAVSPALDYLWLCCKKGWRPAWRAGVFGLGITAVGVAVFVSSSSPLLIVVAGSVGLLAVIVPGGYVAYAEQLKAAEMTAEKAARTDHLQKLADLQKKRIDELAKTLAVSQAQYKVLEDWNANPPAGIARRQR
jgi:hypothetical protein